MAHRFSGQTCAFCRQRPSSRKGEHVWTEWFFSMFPTTDGPYRRYIGEKAETKSDGVTPREHPSAERVQLPCCTVCNPILNRRFEVPARPEIRTIFEANGQLSLDAPAAHAAGLWFLKTWLLLAHPLAKSSWPGPRRTPFDLDAIPDDLYSWMIADEDPPEGLSVWIHRQDLSLPRAQETATLDLPEVVLNTVRTRFQALRCGVRFLDVSVVYHPGWPIEHPLEAQGRAIRIWPPPDGCDLASLSAVPERTFNWACGPTLWFDDAALPAELPELSATLNLIMDLWPYATRAAAAPTQRQTEESA